MTRHNVVAVSDSGLLPTAGQKPPIVPGGYINFDITSSKELLQNLEVVNGGANKVSSWVDSMRASSPTQKSTPLSDDHRAWMVSKLSPIPPPPGRRKMKND